MSVLNDSVSITTETQSSTDSFSLSRTGSSTTLSITTGEDYTSVVTTDGHVVGSVGTKETSESCSQSYTTEFSQSNTESDDSSYTSFEKARFTFV